MQVETILLQGKSRGITALFYMQKIYRCESQFYDQIKHGGVSQCQLDVQNQEV